MHWRVKLPILVSIFLAAPWIVYQVWAFISPGLYKKEKRYAVPFIVFTAGLFITNSTNPNRQKEKDRGGAQQPHGPGLTSGF